nr:GNAT family N-acetyltransferase [Neobacillus sp. Marseille-Q6967]
MTYITFNQIYTPGNVETENELYKHIHYPEMLLRYDSNFIEFKRMPSLTEFKGPESYLREFHMKNGQKHVKFSFPANEKPAGDLLDYMKYSGYMTGFIELYAIEPKQFPLVEDHPDIEIQVVTEENLETYLTLQYQQDLEYGSEFADQKVALHKRNFANPHIQQLFALFKGVPAGSVDIIISKDTAEIDGLVVDEAYQKKGIGSRLQKFVMEKYHDKMIILVADGEDTPRDMYRRQNYQYLGFKYQTYKVHKD